MRDDELLTRKFLVERSNGYVVSYPFTTYSCIWKLPDDPVLSKLYTYFQQLFIEGANGNVVSGLKSVSAGNKLVLDVVQKPSDLTELARGAAYHDAGRYQHRVVERHMLENDPKTIAVEIPVWDDEWVGHIDQLRVMGEVGNCYLQLPDFKPNAHKETKAASQVFRYRALLAKRTGIPLDKIEALYYDDTHAYFLNS